MPLNAFRAAAIAVVGIAASFSSPAWADGAIAVGLTANVQKDGFAYGMVVDKSSEGAARREAIEACRTGPGSGSKEIRSLCRVVGVFKNSCVSMAWDPGDGTPGVGWAIWHPYVFRDPKSNQLHGVTYELVHEMGKSMGVKVEWVEDNWNTLAAGIQANKFEVVNLLAITPPRAEVHVWVW